MFFSIHIDYCSLNFSEALELILVIKSIGEEIILGVAGN